MINSLSLQPKFYSTKTTQVSKPSFKGNFEKSEENPYTIPYYELSKSYIDTHNGYVSYPDLHKVYNNIKSPKDLWQKLGREHESKKYVRFIAQERFEPSREGAVMLNRLDSMSDYEKREFVEIFCAETGFPNLEAVSRLMEKEITNGVHKLSNSGDFDVKFIGYDSNCSVGKRCALPGKDCDGLFIIIDPKDKDKQWLSGSVRWDLKDVINQRIVSTPQNHLPEVLTTQYIEEGLKMTDKLFKKADFTEEDLLRFKENISNPSKDFVKTAKFDIELARKLPTDAETRDKFYKTAMFVELVRDGRVLENNFDEEFIQKIKASTLYEYSNIIKQQNLKGLNKQKHTARRDLAYQFRIGDDEKRFEIVRDILHSSLGQKDAVNKKCFTNEGANGKDEMSNILDMYDLLMSATE